METIPPDPIAGLSDDPQVLKELLREANRRLREQDRRIEQLLQRLDLLLHHIFGRRAEKIDTSQLRFAFAELIKQPRPPEEEPAERAVREAFFGEEPAAEKLRHKARPHGRSRLPEHLVRERIEHPLEEAELACPECGAQRKKMGEEVTEQLDYVPASLIVRQHVRFKYACRCCQAHVAIAPVPPQPIEKGLPGPGLLAQVLVAKFADHCPLYRQSKILERHGVRLSPSTLGDWTQQGAILLEPLVRRFKEVILGSAVLGADDTPVPVLDRSRDHTRLGRLWTYVGDEEHPYIVFEYSPDRSGRWPQAFLSEFQGYLQADAFPGFDALFRVDPATNRARIMEVGCMAHVRRYFHEAQKSDQLQSLIGLAFIHLLYKFESEARGLDPPARRALRQEKSREWIDHFKTWLETARAEVLPKSPIGKAVHYALEQWTALTRYLDDGRLEIDNNRTERALRGVGLGRKNWTFAGSDAGGEHAATIYSVIESAKRHGLDPFAYLRDVLIRVWTLPQNQIDELLPDRWKPQTETD